MNQKPNFEIVRPHQAANDHPEFPGGRDIPLIVHVPHSSGNVPDDIRPQFQLAPEDLDFEHQTMIDHYTDQLFTVPRTLGATMFINRTSRLVLDPERFADDQDEPASAYGMGAVYLKTHNGQDLRSPDFSPGDRAALMARFYEPYHQALSDLVDEFLGRFGCCWIIDAHSYPSEPLPFENPGSNRPRICLGFEDYHEPDGWVRWWEQTVTSENCQGTLDPRKLGFNEPFGGSFVTGRHYHSDPRVKSMMIEMKRSIYMDELTGKLDPALHWKMATLNDFLRYVCEDIVDQVYPLEKGISRMGARRVAEEYLADRVRKGTWEGPTAIGEVCLNIETEASGIQGVRLVYREHQGMVDNSWVVYLASRPGLLCSSTVILVDRDCGEIVYCGSAHDEG